MAELTAAASPRTSPVAAWDRWILLSALCLTGIGLVMVYSASSALAAKRYLDSAYFFKRQFFHLLIGLTIMAVLAYRDYQSLRKLAYPLLFAVLAALILVLIPGVGHRAGGAVRWLRLGTASLQPAEFAKPALVHYLT